MTLQNTHHVVDCPICGRPVDLESRYVDCEIACGHCRGEFVIHETDGGSLMTSRGDCADPLMRAEQLLCTLNDMKACPAERCGRRHSPTDPESDHLEQPSDALLCPPEEAESEVELMPAALLVEHRDEVFARIATDMAEFGVRVVRAKSASEALRLCGKYVPVLVVANVDLPDQNTWSLAGKLRFVDRNTPIWFYQTGATEYRLGPVNFSRVDQYLDYRGDLLGLSETIIDLMSARREFAGGRHDVPERTAA